MVNYLLTFFFLFAFVIAACETDHEDAQAPPTEDPQEMPPEGQQEMGEAIDISEEELTQFARVFMEMEAEQVNPQTDPEGFQEIVEQEGLDIDRIQEINFAVQQDLQLQQDFQRIVEETQQQQME